MNIQHDDQQVINKMMTTADQQMLELAKQKTIEFAKLMSYYKCAMMTLEAKLNVLNEEYSLEFDHNPISSIKTRLKSPLSIKDKLARKNIPFTLSAIEENVNDVAGIRVICSFPDDVYALANALLKQDDISLL